MRSLNPILFGLVVFCALAFFASVMLVGAPPTTQPALTKIKTICEIYVSISVTERSALWVKKFTSDMDENPEVSPSTLECLLDRYSIESSVDNFVFEACTEDPEAPFDLLALKAMGAHLEQCGIAVAQ